MAISDQVVPCSRCHAEREITCHICNLNSRAAKIADPGVDLKTKHAIAGELRELIDSLTDGEFSQVLPHLVPTILEILRSGEVSFLKDSLDTQFRRILIEILHRIPHNDVVRNQVTSLLSGMLHILRHDNEDNGVTCCKAITDLLRSFKVFPADLINDFFSVLHDLLRNIKGLVDEVLSEDSPILDPNVMFPSIRSFKVLSEMCILTVTLVQVNKPLVASALQSSSSLNFEVLFLESPSQKKTREEHEAKGFIWSGMAPNIRNPPAYTDFIMCQIRMVSLLFWAMRGVGDQYEASGEKLFLPAVRLLQDCPANAIQARKDLWVVLQHIMRFILNGPSRRIVLTQIDKLLDENVLLGTSTSRDSLRMTPYLIIGDYIHHQRQELTASQVTRIIQLYLAHIHNLPFPTALTSRCCKVIFVLIDVLVAKENSQNAARILMNMLESCVDKLEAHVIMQNEVAARVEKSKNGENAKEMIDSIFIETARPVGSAAYALEKPEDFFKESRHLVRTLLQGFRSCLSNLRKLDAPTPEGHLISRLFEGCIRCLAHFSPDRELNDAMEWFIHVLFEVNQHVFQEVWTRKIDFFFDTAQSQTRDQSWLLQICQGLLAREATSPTLLAIALRFLVDRMSLLGGYSDQQAGTMLKMYKIAFQSVPIFPATNETILASYLPSLIMDCFPLASKSSKPTHYWHLMRILFRTIGAGSAKLERLTNQVVSLLPEVLECFNRHLHSSEGLARDMIAELCLSVPLKLNPLLPHMAYLMQPLVHALTGGQELVRQGLRTLELCIDNLTPQFLDPTLNVVLRELSEALYSHLVPLPGNHQIAHTTIRILGKLGGRSRKLLNKEPALKYRHYSEPAKVPVSFGGNIGWIDIRPMSVLAAKIALKAKGQYRNHAYTYLESCLTFIMQEGIKNRDQEDVFVRSLEGVFDGIHIEEVKDLATPFIQKLSLHILTKETYRNASNGHGFRIQPSPLLLAYLDALPHALARENADEAKISRTFLAGLVQEFISTSNQNGVTAQNIMPTLHQIGIKFSSMCLEESLSRKCAGCAGIKAMTHLNDLCVKWVIDREVELVRNLLHILKDLPIELSHDAEEVVDVLTRVLRVSNRDLNYQDPSHSRSKLFHLLSIFCLELPSAQPVVRQAAHTCISLLVELSGKPASELLAPHRERTLAQIYTKPLRSLPFANQIGVMEAVRYCLALDPPLAELNEELLRLLHETLALADAEDLTGFARGGNIRQNNLDIIKLRVSCIKLLTASMPITDFFVKQVQTRTRVTSVYFKSLYSSSPEVKEVAHEGLRMVLTHQSRLPKELLQTGLRPILMNLADAKRLSIPGLEGLARLLELLTNYFKVEIGHKLLDHFRSVADPQMLQASSKLPLSENEGITKLVRLANIFHLLPSAANQFLSSLVNNIVQTEAQLHFSGPGPFSEPLAKFLDRYPVDAFEFFMQHLHLPRHVQTLRSILQAKLAPHLQNEIASRTTMFVAHCLKGNDRNLVLPTLMLFNDLAAVSATWIAENGFVIEALLDLWRLDPQVLEQTGIPTADILQRHRLILSIFTTALQQSPRVDLIFSLMTAFTRSLAIDLVQTTQFLYRHVALSSDLIFRRNVLMRFLTWFGDGSVPWAEKMYFIRLVLTPTLLAHAHSGRKGGLLDIDFVHSIHRFIWPTVNEDLIPASSDMFKIDLLHLTTVMVHHYHELLEDVKKDVIRCAWHYINSEDLGVKQTAYLLAARFFEAYSTPQKFILRAWTGLLRPPHTEGRLLTQQALDILVLALPRSSVNEPGYPHWAKTTLRLLAEEGNEFSQIKIIYGLIVRHPQLFYPVRALFIPHMLNSLWKLGLSPMATFETRLLSIEVVQVIYDWEQQASTQDPPVTHEPHKPGSAWARETIISYLLRLATLPRPESKNEHEQQQQRQAVHRVFALLQTLVSAPGWSDVTVKLHFFSRALEQNDFNSEHNLSLAQNAARVLKIITADKNDSWYTSNGVVLQKLIQKGMKCDDHSIHDALHPIFQRLLRLFPLPKEDEERQGSMSEFHAFVYQAIGDGLNNLTAMRGTLLMLKTVVELTPERIEPFSAPVAKLLGKLAKDHLGATTVTTPQFENLVRLIILMLETCQLSVAFLGESRRPFHASLCALVENSKSTTLCGYLLDLGRSWALHKHDPYPTIKDKATFLQKMLKFEKRGDGTLFHKYLELIYDIYNEPTLRRSDLTTRLEPAFLVGCRAHEGNLREKFMDLLDASIPRTLFSRLSYILGIQSWEALAEHNWIYVALHLLLGTIDVEAALLPDRKVTFPAPTLDSPLRLRAQNIIRPMQRLAFLDSQAASDIWVSVFPAAWTCLSRKEQIDVTHHMISILTKHYHIAQATMRPNVIETLLAGVHACSPPMILPPHLVKYLAKTYGAWYIAMEILEASWNLVRDDEGIPHDAVSDSLADVYAELAEDDMFYGSWRRRCLHIETNMGIAFEQNGMWEQASSVYEMAQSRTRTGTIPFSEPEYYFWEDHWMLSAEKLQQWDTLYELARNDHNQELTLESAWRIKDWTETREQLEEQIKFLPDVGTPRRRVFEAFIALLKSPSTSEKNSPFTVILEDAMQLSLRKWISLPTHLCHAHVPLLQHFQQFVELQEAVGIFGSLAATNAQNLEKRSSELQMVLQAWRERLPNFEDDISVWSDLVAWRQNVFSAINKAYIPLITNTVQGSSTKSNTSGYRGYHETAWIINRFAHIARRHELLDVCFTFLNKIYTLPNIEISEAFLKIREQAKCHYQKPNDLQAGLDVIHNTNLMYFSTAQKADFFTLKAMFLARFGRSDEASATFGQAIQMDMSLPKAWSEYGKWNDRMFKEQPNDMSYASHAVSCYLNAVGLYKSGKCRPLIARILWLLSVDDSSLQISKSFDTYKGDAAFWYWISFIPQLCLSISQREVKQARYILHNLAKLFPQALFFPLRTTREDMLIAKKLAVQNAARASSGQSVSHAPGGETSSQTSVEQSVNGDSLSPKRDGSSTVMSQGSARAPHSGFENLRSSSPSGKTLTGVDASSSAFPPRAPSQTPVASSHSTTDTAATFSPRQPGDYIEELFQILKTSFPLLVLSMETLVDQITTRFKTTPDEEAYRILCIILQDFLSSYMQRLSMQEDDGQLPPQAMPHLERIASVMSGSILREFQEDFLETPPSFFKCLQLLQKWRDRYEKHLDSRPRIQSIDFLSHYLADFQYTKVDEIEVPGQYTEDKDTNNGFIKIFKFEPKFENSRSLGFCSKRITIHGHDQSRTSFLVQFPSPRICRREERVMQVLRTFNGALSRKKEARKRNLSFHVPASISCSPSLRLLQTDSSYISFGDILDQHCQEVGILREDPIMVVTEKVKHVLRDIKQHEGRTLNKTDYVSLKKDLFDEVATKMIPTDVLTRYMIRTMTSQSDLWRMRKQFALQVATTAFATYVFCLTGRTPARFHLSRKTGLMAMSELLPGYHQNAVFGTSDAVPFRYTPNMQHFMGPIFLESIITSGIMSIGRALTEPEQFEMEQHICLFVRDETVNWLQTQKRPWNIDITFRTTVNNTIDAMFKRAEAMACKIEREQTIQNPQNIGQAPVIQTVTNLISSATNPLHLNRMPETWMPWF